MDGGYDTEPIHAGCMDRGRPTRNAVARDARREARRPQAAMLPPRRLEVRGRRFQAACYKVALSDRRLGPRVCLGEGIAAAPAHPARVRTEREALPQPWRGRARVRQAQERMGARTAPRAPVGARPATR